MNACLKLKQTRRVTRLSSMEDLLLMKLLLLISLRTKELSSVKLLRLIANLYMIQQSSLMNQEK